VKQLDSLTREPSAPRAAAPASLDSVSSLFDSGALLRGALICLALLWLYSDVLARLAGDWWTDENYSHGLLLPFISGYVIWSHRHRFCATPRQPRPWVGGGLMLVAVMMLVAGTVGAEFYISRLSLIVALASLVLYFFGWGWLRLLAFPIGLFLLAIPIPTIIFNQIAFPLQLLASDYATRVITLLGIPALREGNVIELARMKLQVVEACSGIRSLMALATLGVTYAYFGEPRWWRRIVLVAAVIPIAIIANAARVAGTGVLAHYRGVEAAEGFMHGFSGWLIFLAALVMLLTLARILNLVERLFARAPRRSDKSRRMAEPLEETAPASKSAGH
jgi:exosortase